jgi:hypothetical protein
MDRMKLFLPILGLAVCLSMTACSSIPASTPRPGYFLTVSYSSGGQGPLVSNLYFYGDSRLELDAFGEEPWRSKLTPLESRRLAELLESQGFEETQASIEGRDFPWDCCDLEDIAVRYRGHAVLFPCGEEAPKALQDLGTLVNDIAWSHFRYWSFIPSDCLVGKEKRR